MQPGDTQSCWFGPSACTGTVTAHVDGVWNSASCESPAKETIQETFTPEDRTTPPPQSTSKAKLGWALPLLASGVNLATTDGALVTICHWNVVVVALTRCA